MQPVPPRFQKTFDRSRCADSALRGLIQKAAHPLNPLLGLAKTLTPTYALGRPSPAYGWVALLDSYALSFA